MDVKKTQKPSKRGQKSEEGMAIIETLPLLAVFVILVSYGLGMWGAVHTGILHSIAARTYAFETFRNRTNLSYFRDNDAGRRDPRHYAKWGLRLHGIQSRFHTGPSESDFNATKKRLSLVIYNDGDSSAATKEDHNLKLEGLIGRNPRGSGVGVNPIWIMVGYTMCLNHRCGGN